MGNHRWIGRNTHQKGQAWMIRPTRRKALETQNNTSLPTATAVVLASHGVTYMLWQRRMTVITLIYYRARFHLQTKLTIVRNIPSSDISTALRSHNDQCPPATASASPPMLPQHCRRWPHSLPALPITDDNASPVSVTRSSSPPLPAAHCLVN